MLAPNDPSKYIKMICIESTEYVDHVWGNCSLVKGQSYDVLPEIIEGYVLVKFRNGLCPHEIKYLKTISDIRDEKLDNIF